MDTTKTKLAVGLVTALLATSSVAADGVQTGSIPGVDSSMAVLAMNEEQQKPDIEHEGSSLEETGEGLESSVGRTGQAIDDVAISASIKARFVEDPALSADDINVDTALGVVTLSGTVMSDEAKDHATEVAGAVEGVVSVENRLEVGSPESVGKKTSDFVDDAVITTKVKSLLIGESSLSAAGINVDTAKGIVTLSGTVSSTADIEKAEDIAARVEGVHTVDNRLTVK